ncbi:hypothetical protein [Bacillus sp. CDB3]|uniref:hypothetical protein n=1 Tax=Bacillus sp. CDB3 TaxID=360310 RepID=UPI001153A3BD|nr:hypothetical protein [Bacillus sp. CDB3]
MYGIKQEQKQLKLLTTIMRKTHLLFGSLNHKYFIKQDAQTIEYVTNLYRDRNNTSRAGAPFRFFYINGSVAKWINRTDNSDAAMFIGKSSKPNEYYSNYLGRMEKEANLINFKDVTAEQ